MARNYEDAIAAAAEQYPREQMADYVYGTAGFRMEADLLDSVMFAVGILAALRSRKLKGQAIGVMITASHNKAEDNGVKLVDPLGDMLEQSWESYATELANCPPEYVKQAYLKTIKDLNIDLSMASNVIIARDTRPSGERLLKALIAGLDAAGAKHTDYGVLTTPQLHYLTRATNTQNDPQPFGEVSEEGYYKKLSEAYKIAMRHSKSNGSLSIDCANGVGAIALKRLLKYLPGPEEKAGGIKIDIVNDRVEDPAVLNEKCGADYVKTCQRVPANFSGEPYDRWASYDGDADRIVFYFVQEGKVFRLLDGDRIACLAATFIGELVHKSGLSDKLSLAVVQTAYANGASTRYIEHTLKLKVECTPTGVKHLHHVASRYDIGVYFEANGHGTVLFSAHALKQIRKVDPQSPAQLEALTTLRALVDLINQTVGDALSDMLLAEVILAQKEYTVKEWLSTYKDMPNKLIKVLVPAKDEYKTVPGTAERRLAEPVGLQDRLDSIIEKYRDGRCFVRASGTENAVRIYGEAAEPFDVDDMLTKVEQLISTKG